MNLILVFSSFVYMQSCALFVANPFKPQICRDCSRHLRDHQTGASPPKPSPVLPTAKELQEEKKRALLKQKQAPLETTQDWFHEDTMPSTSSPDSLDLEDDDFKMLTDLVPVVTSRKTSVVHAAKVKNLIDFDEDTQNHTPQIIPRATVALLPRSIDYESILQERDLRLEIITEERDLLKQTRLNDKATLAELATVKAQLEDSLRREKNLGEELNLSQKSLEETMNKLQELDNMQFMADKKENQQLKEVSQELKTAITEKNRYKERFLEAERELIKLHAELNKPMLAKLLGSLVECKWIFSSFFKDESLNRINSSV